MGNNGKCWRCGGAVFRDYEEDKCINCGRALPLTLAVIPKPVRKTLINLPSRKEAQIARDYKTMGWRRTMLKWQLAPLALYNINGVQRLTLARARGNKGE